jgi:hypothetical protein
MKNYQPPPNGDKWSQNKLQCYPKNTTRVVFLVLAIIHFYLSSIIFNHDLVLIKNHANWYNLDHDEKYHFGGTGCGIYMLRIPLVLRLKIVGNARSKKKYHSRSQQSRVE